MRITRIDLVNHILVMHIHGWDHQCVCGWNQRHWNERLNRDLDKARHWELCPAFEEAATEHLMLLRLAR